MNYLNPSKQVWAVIVQYALMAYQNYNVPFDIYTDSSDYHLGAYIMQGGRPVAYYSKKLSSAQRNYTTKGKELLVIFVVLKEFCSLLLGSELNVYIEPQNN